MVDESSRLLGSAGTPAGRVGVPSGRPSRLWLRILTVGAAVGVAALLGAVVVDRHNLSAPPDAAGTKAVRLDSSETRSMVDVTVQQKQALRELLSAMSMDEHRLAFGHQMTTYKGQFFTDPLGKAEHSDVLNITGEFPVVYGMDFAHVIENEGGLATHVAKAFARGGITQFMWLTPNPVNGGDSYNKTDNPCTALLPGQKANDQWLAYLDKIADFLHVIEPVPVVFRFLHEMTGWWYWWGIETECSDDDFVAVWQYTHTYLTEYRDARNVLWLFATSRFSASNKTSASETTRYMENRYPGDDFVDLIGFDCYENNTWTAPSLVASCDAVFEFAKARGKTAVIGETGHTSGSQMGESAGWWGQLLDGFSAEGSSCHEAAYALTWENYSPEKYWVPLNVEGERKQAADFLEFFHSNKTMFSRDQAYLAMANETSYGALG